LDTSSPSRQLWHGQSHFAKDLSLQPEINRRAGDALVAHQITNRFDADLASEEAHGKGVPQAIGEMMWDWQSAAAHPIFEKRAHGRFCKGDIRRCGTQKKFAIPALPTSFVEITPQQIKRLWV
jgi:hypothetical protein